MLELSARFPAGAPRSATHTFSGASYTFAKSFALMLEIAAAMAAMPVTDGCGSGRPKNERKPDQNCKQNL